MKILIFFDEDIFPKLESVAPKSSAQSEPKESDLANREKQKAWREELRRITRENADVASVHFALIAQEDNSKRWLEILKYFPRPSKLFVKKKVSCKKYSQGETSSAEVKQQIDFPVVHLIPPAVKGKKSVLQIIEPNKFGFEEKLIFVVSNKLQSNVVWFHKNWFNNSSPKAAVNIINLEIKGIREKLAKESSTKVIKEAREVDKPEEAKKDELAEVSTKEGSVLGSVESQKKEQNYIPSPVQSTEPLSDIKTDEPLPRFAGGKLDESKKKKSAGQHWQQQKDFLYASISLDLGGILNRKTRSAEFRAKKHENLKNVFEEEKQKIQNTSDKTALIIVLKELKTLFINNDTRGYWPCLVRLGFHSTCIKSLICSIDNILVILDPTTKKVPWYHLFFRRNLATTSTTLVRANYRL